MSISLYPHQRKALNVTAEKNRVAYYLDMGLGKTFVGSEKMLSLNENKNLLVCQCSKIQDWIEHFKTHYDYQVYDLTKPKQLEAYLASDENERVVGIINYDLIFRRPQLKSVSLGTMVLDESSMIQNENAKRSKFILRLKPKNVILLSGTPVSGRYEKLYSQCQLLGWNISKKLFWDNYVITREIDVGGTPIKLVVGYKNIERLKRKLREFGSVFMKSEEVIELPEQIFNVQKIKVTSEYKKFKKNALVEVEGMELVGDTTLTKMLYERQLCGQYNPNKLKAFADLLESTEDRLIVFYNFTSEYEKLVEICERMNKPISVVSGFKKDLTAYENEENSVTLVQYQSGSKGLNLQKANKIVYFTLPLSVENWMQSQKRTNRIGQTRTCFYYILSCKNSIEEKIYKALSRGVSFTDKLFEESL